MSYNNPQPSPVALPHWLIWIRAAQAVFAVIVLALTAYPVSVFGGGGYTSSIVSVYPGFGLSWFAFAWTVLFLAYVFFGFQRTPANAKPLIILLILELLTALWWLVSFALVATAAASLSLLYDAAYFYDPSSSGSGSSSSSDPYSSSYNPTSYYYGNSGYKTKRDATTDLFNKFRAAVDTTKAAAGIGGLEFALFLVTSAFVIRAIVLNHRAQAQQVKNPNATTQYQGQEGMQGKPEAMA